MAKYHGFDVKLARSDGLGGWTTIAQVRDITGPGLELNTIDATDRDSSNKWMEFVSGLKDGGEVSFDIAYDPSNATHGATSGLLDMLEQGTSDSFQVQFPGGVSWTFTAFVTGFEPSAPLDDLLTASVTMKLTGQPTLA